MRPNWFFGFPIDGSFVATLPALPPGLRRSHPDDVHLTLVFLGGCGEAAARDAFEMLAGMLASPRGTLEISLGQVVPMGSPRAYTALSALLEQGRDQTAACIGELRDPLCDVAGRPRQRRPPKPHVTLARPSRNATNAQREAGLVWAERAGLSGVQAVLDRIALYTWSEPRRERRFRIVAQVPLDPSLEELRVEPTWR